MYRINRYSFFPVWFNFDQPWPHRINSSYIIGIHWNLSRAFFSFSFSRKKKREPMLLVLIRSSRISVPRSRSSFARNYRRERNEKQNSSSEGTTWKPNGKTKKTKKKNETRTKRDAESLSEILYIRSGTTHGSPVPDRSLFPFENGFNEISRAARADSSGKPPSVFVPGTVEINLQRERPVNVSGERRITGVRVVGDGIFSEPEASRLPREI